MNRITFIPVNNIPDAQIQELYEAAFPKFERRPWPQQLLLLKEKKLRLLQLVYEGQFAGFVFYWQLSEYILIEHFAIIEALRSKGIGSIVIQHMAGVAKFIVLETEPADHGPDAVRRIDFYEKLGFITLPYPYSQPPYADGYPAQKMSLMQNKPHTGGAAEFEKLKQEIYATVYGVTGA